MSDTTMNSMSAHNIINPGNDLNKGKVDIKKGICTVKVCSYEDFFPVSLVLEGLNSMDHNF
jgi:hypothetical protein